MNWQELTDKEYNLIWDDFISLTDMLKAKDGDFFISDLLRNRNTVEFLGIWETVNNPNFNYGEFATIRSQAGINNHKISAKEWRDANPDKEGNILDHATLELTNLESLNAVLIEQELPQGERLAQLSIAISQLNTLIKYNSTKRLK